MANIKKTLGILFTLILVSSALAHVVYAAGAWMGQDVLNVVEVPMDTDQDGIPDDQDNCIRHSNPDQRDTDDDGYGNVCDPDLDNNGAVGISDFSLFRSCFGATLASRPECAEAEFDFNGAVGISDFSIFRAFFGKAPGPSGVAP